MFQICNFVLLHFLTYKCITAASSPVKVKVHRHTIGLKQSGFSVWIIKDHWSVKTAYTGVTLHVSMSYETIVLHKDGWGKKEPSLK